MIRHIRVNVGSVVFLSLSINLTPLAPALARSQDSSTKVAFLGVHFEGLEQKACDKIQNDFVSMLQLEQSLDVKTPADVEQLVGAERLRTLLREVSRDSMLYLSALLQVDHVFAATIKNESKDTNQIILVGSYSRYDRWTGAVYTYSILRFYQNFHEDLKVIREQFVSTIVQRKESILHKWPFIVVAGLAIMGIILLILSKTGGGEEGQRPPEPTPA